MRARVWAVWAGLLLSGCATTQAIPPVVESLNHPALHAVAVVEVGEAALVTGQRRIYAGLVLTNELTWGDGVLLKRFTVSPGRLQARQKDGRFTYYFSDSMTARDALLGVVPYASGGLCRANDGSGPVRGFIVAGRCALNWNRIPEVADSRIAAPEAGGRRRELIYHGRSGDSVRFLYRESVDDGPPSTQTIAYDLGDSAMIGFRGARLEVLEADGLRLRYRLLASFVD